MVLDIDDCHSYPKWVAMGEEWDALLSESDEQDIFLGSEWLQAWWEIFGEGRRLHIVTAREKGVLVGAAPLMTTRIGKLVKITIEEFIGTGPSDRLGAFAGKGDTRVQKVLWKHIMDLKDYDILDLRDMREDCTTAKVVRDVLAGADCETTASPWIPIHGAYDDYLRGLSSNYRHSIARSWTRLKEEHEASIEVLTEPERMQEGMRTLIALSEMRWEGRGTSILDDDKMRTFLERALDRLSQNGQAIFHVLQASGTPIAITLGFITSNRYLYYLSGFDPQYQSYGPGRSLLVKVLEDCYARGLGEMDLLRGGEEYKYKFKPQQRRLLHCRYGRGVKANISERMGR
ncbi:MAG: GNAT family N-acetyltransferase [Methanomassiliicoccales archaeon]|nr:GNAT family N-acetyltransferase [Methanomassiliicoccales archaeon]